MTDTSNLVREVRETKDAVEAQKKAFQAYIDKMKSVKTDDPEVQRQIDQAVADLNAIQDDLSKAVFEGTDQSQGGSIGGANPQE